MHKICNKCGVEKPISEFHKQTNCAMGVRGTCKECRIAAQIEYQNARRDWYLEYQRDHYANNRDSYSERSAEYRKKNTKLIRDAKRVEYEKNKKQYVLRATSRKKHIKTATPKWANHNIIADMYALAVDGFHVDHIIPLRGRNVCGLHVEHNLQVIPAKDNLEKGNRTDDY